MQHLGEGDGSYNQTNQTIAPAAPPQGPYPRPQSVDRLTLSSLDVVQGVGVYPLVGHHVVILHQEEHGAEEHPARVRDHFDYGLSLRGAARGGAGRAVLCCCGAPALAGPRAKLITWVTWV